MIKLALAEAFKKVDWYLGLPAFKQSAGED